MKGAVRALVVAAAAPLVVGALGFAVGRDCARVGGIPVPVWCGALALALNWLAFIPAALARSERFYDATGSASFIAVTLTALAAAPDREVARTVPALLVLAWTSRLGWFLVTRIRRAGKDGRFDDMKTKPARFVIAWTLQGLWVFVTASPALVLLTMSTRDRASFHEVTPAEIAGWCVWAAGFLVEVVSDRQKRAFVSAHPGAFIHTGLWAWSRHPNYFGEIVLWLGVFASGAQRYRGLEWLCALSPLFVFALLRFVSGVPLLEKRADDKYGADPAYRAYKDRTPLLIPRPPRGR